MAECIDREALLHDIEQSVVYTARGKITSAEMRGAHKIIERIKCAPAVEPIYIHEPTKSEYKRMAVQMGYEQVVHCKDCQWFANNNGGEWFGCWLFNAIRAVPEDAPTPDDFCSKGERKGRDDGQTMWAGA